MGNILNNATEVQRLEAERARNAELYFEEFLSKRPRTGSYTIAEVIDLGFQGPMKEALHDAIDPLGKLLEQSGQVERSNRGSHSYQRKESPRNFLPETNPNIHATTAAPKQGIITSLGKFIINKSIEIIVAIVIAYLIYQLGWN